jgi:Rieske Fe-S protein
MSQSHGATKIESESEAETAPQSRRSFLGALAWIFAGIIGLVTGVAGAIYAIYPAFPGKREQEEPWQAITPISQIPEGKPTRFTFNLVERAGWAETTVQQAVWITRQGQNLVVFSAVCPHEGCTVDHEPKGFICRCHLSQWQDDGTKVAGPTARGLDKLEYRVTNNQLEVKYQNFRRGIDSQIPVA